MEKVLTSLRRFSAGACGESVVYAAASAAFAQTNESRESRTVTDSVAMFEDEPNLDDMDLGLPTLGTPALQASRQLLRKINDSSDEENDELGDKFDNDEEFMELYTWGMAKNYQLGYGTAGEEQPTPRLVKFPTGISIRSISCGRFHTLVLTTCGSVFAWGFGGNNGRLGIDAKDAVEAKYLVEPTRLPEFGPSRHFAVKVAAGLDHSLALTGSGKILAWGSNECGQLGLSGASCGSGSSIRQPTVLKVGPLKGLLVKDIAAGASHSLCLIEDSTVYAWGSNSLGSLGLGTAAADVVQLPQQLPHVRGVSVTTTATGNVSIILALHGDAVIFGTCGTKKPTSGAVDARFFVPSRVRRLLAKRKVSVDDADDWEQQKGSTAGSPLTSVTVVTDTALGVDKAGTIWSWSLTSTRPCFAEMVPIAPGTSEAVLPSRISKIVAAERSGIVWALDETEHQSLWQLKRPQHRSSAESLQIERSDQLAQAVDVACGSEHQAAIVVVKRPKTSFSVQSRVASPSLPNLPSPFLLQAQAWSPGHDHHLCVQPLDTLDDSFLGQPAVPLLKPASGDGSRRQPPSLQQICEDRMTCTLTPRNFGLLCEVAFELNRPHLIDRVFTFLNANAALMFSRLYLPILAQLPREVLIALELAMAGQVPCPSIALDGLMFGREGPWEELLNEKFETSKIPVEDASMQSKAKDLNQRQKKRSSGSPQISTIPGLSPGMVIAPSPKLVPAYNMSPKVSQTPGSPATALLDKQDWVPVLNKKINRMAGSAAAGKATSPVQLFQSSPKLSAGVSSANKPSTRSPPGPKAACPDTTLTKQLPLFDFVKPAKQATKSKPQPQGVPKSPAVGPSAMLSAAVQVIHGSQVKEPKQQEDSTEANPASTEKTESSSRWVVPTKDPGSQANIREILADQQKKASPDALPKKEARGKVTEEATKCSWGFDAMPSEQSKGISVYELQKQEETLKAEDEILEIEAMFAALAVAEQEEELERLNSTASSSSAGKGKSQNSKNEKTKHSTGPEKSAKTRNGKDRLVKSTDTSSWSQSSWNSEWWSKDSWQGYSHGSNKQRWTPKPSEHEET